jgi:hypothetical protein
LAQAGRAAGDAMGNDPNKPQDQENPKPKPNPNPNQPQQPPR